MLELQGQTNRDLLILQLLCYTLTGSSLFLKMATDPPSSTLGNSGNFPVPSLCTQMYHDNIYCAFETSFDIIMSCTCVCMCASGHCSYLVSMNHCRIWSCICSFISGPSVSASLSLMTSVAYTLQKNKKQNRSDHSNK